MVNIFGGFVNLIFSLIGFIIFIGIIVCLLKNWFSRVIKTDATVIDKQYSEKQIYSKANAAYPKKEYIITFLCGKQKKYFSVSEFSYNGYQIGEKGKLTYKGNKIINFEEDIV